MRYVPILVFVAGCIPAPGASLYDPNGDVDGDGVPNGVDCAPEETGSDTITAYTDADGDGYGDPATAHEVCAPDPGDVLDGTDCDDADAKAYPGQTWIFDYDGDGYPNDQWTPNVEPFYIPAVVITACAQPDPFVDQYGQAHPYVLGPADDCRDDERDVYPGAPDLCSNAIDDDCDGRLDRCTLGAEADAVDAVAILADGIDDGGLGWPIASAGATRAPGAASIAVGALDGGRVRLFEPQFDAGSFVGIASVDVTGMPVGVTARGAAAGDLDGDGNDDLIVSASADSGTDNGRGWLLFGPIAADRDVATGVPITAAGVTSALGWQVGTVGDVDDDGFSDVAITAPDLGAGAGRAFILSGGGLRARSGVSVERDATWTITGSVAGEGGLGASIAPLGDVDADGVADFAIGAFGSSPGSAMEAFVVLGAPGAGGDISASDAAICTFRTSQVTAGTPRVGPVVAGAGDLNGDGTDEIVIGGHGDPDGPTGTGRAWLVTDVGNNCGEAGVVVLDADPLAWNVAQFVDPGDSSLGFSVAGLGDADGDGYSDLAIAGDRAANGSIDAAGVVYLVSGRGIVTGFTWDLTSDIGDRIVWSRVRGDLADERFGAAVAGVGDLDGDGLGDVVVGDLRDGSGPADPRAFLFTNGIEE